MPPGNLDSGNVRAEDLDAAFAPEKCEPPTPKAPTTQQKAPKAKTAPKEKG